MIDLPVARQIRHLPRYRHIVDVFVRHGFGFALNLLPIRRRWLRRLQPFPIPERYSLPTHFRQALEELGPTFVKLGQVLSTRPDLLPPAYIAELSRLQEAVPPVPWEELRVVVEEELGRPPEELFLRIDPEPRASASLGQVHEATLPTREEVVIKIQRPNIRRTIKIDLQILADLARYAERRTPLGEVYELTDVAHEFAQTLQAELDYQQEGRNAERFRRNFADESCLYVPRVFWEYTTERVLVLERLEGIKIDDLTALEAGGHDLEALANRAAALTVQEVLEDGFFHADPHPGNLIVMEDGAIGVMDFGMVGYLTDADRVDLIRLYAAAVRQDAEAVVDGLIHAGAASPEVDGQALAREIASLLRRYAGRPVKEISAAEVMNEVRPIVFSHHLHLPANFWLLGKSLAMMEGIGRRLHPDFDIFAFSRPYVTRLVLRHVLPNRRWLDGLLRQGLQWGDLLDELPRAGLLLLDRFERREPLHLAIEKSSLDRLDRLVTRLALSLIIAGMIIGLALVIPTVAETDLLLRVILILGFVVALGLGAWVLISTLRRR
jgi:ubiquinone biosynthesis protein